MPALGAPRIPHFCAGVSMCVHAKSLQSSPTLCDPMDCSLQAPLSVGILQARILERVAMPSSRDLPNPGVEPMSLKFPSLAGEFFTTSATKETQISSIRYINYSYHGVY